MSIEIKELQFKIEVSEVAQKAAVETINSIDIKALKASVIKSCTKEILEILKERQER
jgi:hypothetical protein